MSAVSRLLPKALFYYQLKDSRSLKYFVTDNLYVISSSFNVSPSVCISEEYL